MSTFSIMVISVLGFLMSALTLSFQSKHLLSVLLSLEAITMNLFIMVFVLCDNITFSGYSSLILISLGVCEGSLGLAVLVSVIRSQGNDYVYSISLQKC